MKLEDLSKPKENLQVIRNLVLGTEKATANETPAIFTHQLTGIEPLDAHSRANEDQTAE